MADEEYEVPIPHYLDCYKCGLAHPTDDDGDIRCPLDGENDD